VESLLLGYDVSRQCSGLETSETAYLVTHRHIPEELNPNLHRYENRKTGKCEDNSIRDVRACIEMSSTRQILVGKSDERRLNVR
jgi:hypothetical protein